jgi:hypothetical protein
MKPETEARIRNVQKFGRYARSFCLLIGATLGLVLLVSWATIFSVLDARSGVRLDLGAFNVTGDQLTTLPNKAWALVVVTVVFGAVGWTLFHLHRLFTHLAAGSIYTKQNVWHLRQVGLLSMALAVIHLILPPITFALVETGLIDVALVPRSGTYGGTNLVFGTSSFGGFITASLILLASWIMDVGREVSDDADAMRREADLVI